MLVNIELNPEFPTDSYNYEVLTLAVEAAKGVEGMTCEIGVRRGGGSKYMLDALVATDQKHKTHVCIDPWGNIEYYADETLGHIRQDYTNEMRDDCMMNLYLFGRKSGVNILVFPFEDEEFFKRFADGVPIYQQFKRIENKYSVIHHDGPHHREGLAKAIEFFDARTDPGATMVFDDVELYPHGEIHEVLEAIGWACIAQTPRKWAYQKRGEAVPAESPVVTEADVVDPAPEK